MYQPDPQRLDLAREFLAKPHGVHSPELHALLNHLRLVQPGGKLLLLATDPGKEWTVVRLVGEPPRAEPLADYVFDDLPAAERAVFRLRWRHLMGRELTLD